MEYSKKRAKVINANVLVQQIEWDLIGAAAGAECIWFGPHLQTVLSRAVHASLSLQPSRPLLSILLSHYKSYLQPENFWSGPLRNT